MRIAFVKRAMRHKTIRYEYVSMLQIYPIIPFLYFIGDIYGELNYLILFVIEVASVYFRLQPENKGMGRMTGTCLLPLSAQHMTSARPVMVSSDWSWQLSIRGWQYKSLLFAACHLWPNLSPPFAWPRRERML